MYFHALLEFTDGTTDWYYNRNSLAELEKLGKIISYEVTDNRIYGY